MSRPPSPIIPLIMRGSDLGFQNEGGGKKDWGLGRCGWNPSLRLHLPSLVFFLVSNRGFLSSFFVSTWTRRIL